MCQWSGAGTVKCEPWAFLVTGTVLGSDANPYLTALATFTLSLHGYHEDYRKREGMGTGA